MDELNLIDLLDAENLPLKNRIGKDGFYAPRPLIPAEPLRAGEQYRFHFDMTRCIGCNCCVVACNEQNGNPAEVNWRRVGEVEGGIYPRTQKYHLSMACNHCLDPACLNGCPTEAYIKVEDGIVKHRAEECIGCGYCTWNCPYGVPQYNPERRIVTKCDMCHSRLKDGMLPACVAACPQGAIRIEKVNIEEWLADHAAADAPYVPHSGMTLSTTRITLPPDIPADMLKANRHRLEPEKPHASLVLMTVLTQLAAGGFFMLWLGDMLSRGLAFFKPLKEAVAFGAGGMLAVTVIALLSAVFHLGRPVHAYKALRNWKKSWLSREVLLFALFSKAGALYSALLLAEHFELFSMSVGLMAALGGMVSIFGMAGIYASAMIYRVPARPAWDTPQTSVKFFMTGLILGPLFALVIYGAYFFAGNRLPDMGPLAVFVWVPAAAALIQLAVLLSGLLHLKESSAPALYGTASLLIHRFRTLFILRIASLAAACLLVPAVFYAVARSGDVSVLLAFAAAGFLLSLAAELAGRYLFFVTVVPQNIPGSFFTKGVHE